jgi:enoyl-CoA hydratase/carnithine racemase
MTRGVVVEMRKALEDAKNDSDIKVIIITAAGAGFHYRALVFREVREDQIFTPMEFREIIQIGHELYRMIETLEKPVIGVAKGGAMGGGLENLHACDFVIAADTAMFSQPEVMLSLICGWGGEHSGCLVLWNGERQRRSFLPVAKSREKRRSSLA